MKLYQITFSPTGGTQRVASLLAAGLAEETIPVDLTNSRQDFAAVQLTQEDTAVIAVPSYGGRVPAVAVERLTALKGQGARAVLVCVYGNRAYEDTLVELADAAQKAGFRVIAAVAAVAEHSIARQFAAGRPDAQQLASFAEKIRRKLSANDGTEPALPGNRPYKKSGGAVMVPKATNACNRCGICADECPVQAIHQDDPTRVDGNVCISCMRCVAACPQKARRLNPLLLSAAGLMLKKACSQRKECELFL